MFIWFIWQDSKSSLWQSGMLRLSGQAKPALSTYTKSAKPLDARNPLVGLRAGTKQAKVKLIVREFCAGAQAGAKIGATVRVKQGAKLLSSAQPQLTLARDCSVTAPLSFPAIKKKARYVATVEMNDVDGVAVNRTATLVGT